MCIHYMLHVHSCVIAELRSKVARTEQELGKVTAHNLDLEKTNAALVALASAISMHAHTHMS